MKELIVEAQCMIKSKFFITTLPNISFATAPAQHPKKDPLSVNVIQLPMTYQTSLLSIYSSYYKCRSSNHI